MKAAKELLDLLGRNAGLGKDNVFPGIVKSMDAGNTCTVMVDETEYYDVRLQAITEGRTGAVIMPAINSVVLVHRIGTSNEFFVCMYSQISEAKTTIGTNTITHNAEGVELKGGEDTLGSVIGDLIMQIKLISCNVTAVGAPTGVPINSAAFDLIKTRLDLFIK